MSTPEPSDAGANTADDGQAQRDREPEDDPLTDEKTTLGAIAADEDDDLLGSAEEDATTPDR